MKLVVSDTGPLLHLSEAQSLDLLRLAGDVHTPPAVAIEMAHLDAGWSSAPPTWIKLTQLSSPHDALAAAWEQADLLDRGEAEALALARQIQADWFLTDDAAARVLALSLGVEVHGSLGVVLWAAATGHLNRVTAETALRQLAVSSLWISPRVLQEATEALDQIFPSANT